jgi:asparagine synthase (glutamine-hydrolysing)
MCGILGELRLQPGASRADWTHLMQAMIRRGPDDLGLWNTDENCTLGFRRLSILDLSELAHQPMISGDGTHVLVFNGELYNFRELRQDLIARGIRFRSTGDAEVVLSALMEWGVRALERFNGMFALGFYSTRDRRLLLARDHAGIKPLYVMQDRRGWVFSSQYDQVLSHPWGKDRAISNEGRALYLRLGYIPAPYAMMNGTEMLEPGTWLQIEANGAVHRGRFFEFPQARSIDLRGTDAVEAIDDALNGAVERQMVSDVPVGAFLSGGIDSPLVTAKMAAAGGAPFPAFTIGTETVDTDESTDAAAYAAALGVQHVMHRVTAAEALALVPDVVRACGEPFADYSIFPTMLVSRLASEHVKVVLSGDGGDELFLGYAGRFSKVLRVAEQFAQPHWLRNARWGMKKYLGLGSATYDLRRPSIGEWYRSRHTRIPEDQLGRIFPTIGAWPEAMDAYEYRGSGVDETAQWLRWNEFTNHLTMVLLKVDRASMYHSLEVRVPLLDRAVIEIASRTDWRSLLDPATEVGKLPLRQLLARRVGHHTLKKRGFTVPMDEWLRGKLRPLFEERLFDRTELAGLPIQRSELKRWFAEHVSGSADHAWGLWVLLSLALWEDEFMAHRP